MSRRIAVVILVVMAAACSSGDDAATDPTDAVDSTESTNDDGSGEANDPATSAATSTSVQAPPTSDTTTATTESPPQPSTTEAKSSTSPPASSSTTSSTPADDDAELTDAETADQELARTALLTLDDFPDGWIEVPDDNEDDDPATAAFEEDFDACLGRDADDQIGDQLERIEASTGDFQPVDSNSTDVSHDVTLAPDEDTAIDRMAETDVGGAEDCIADVIGDFYRTAAADDPDLSGIEIGEVVVTRTETDRDPDLTNATQIEVELLADGQSVPLFLEFLFQRQGRALSQLSFSSFGEPFDRDGYVVLADQAVTRLATIG